MPKTAKIEHHTTVLPDLSADKKKPERAAKKRAKKAAASPEDESDPELV